MKATSTRAVAAALAAALCLALVPAAEARSAPASAAVKKKRKRCPGKKVRKGKKRRACVKRAPAAPTVPATATSGQPPTSGPTGGASLGNCPVFPPAPAGGQSLPDQRAWNQDVSGSPPDTSASATAFLTAFGGSDLHPDFGTDPDLGYLYGIPYVVVPGTQPAVPISFGNEGENYDYQSDPGPYPIPPDAPKEYGDGDEHVVSVDGDNCLLYELYNAEFLGGPQKLVGRQLGGALGPAFGRDAPRRLDLGRRGRAADLPRTGPIRGSRRGGRQPRDPGHLQPHPRLLDQARDP